MENNEILDIGFNEYHSEKEAIELVSRNNFILLNIITFGIYTVWWMFKSWRFFEEKRGADVIPVLRAFFCIIFTYSLFEHIQQYARRVGYHNSFSSTGLFVLFILLNLTGQFPDPYWLVSLLAFLPLIQPHQTLNDAIIQSGEYAGFERSGFNNRQIILIIVGLLFWGLVLIGLFVPIEDY